MYYKLYENSIFGKRIFSPIIGDEGLGLDFLNPRTADYIASHPSSLIDKSRKLDDIGMMDRVLIFDYVEGELMEIMAEMKRWGPVFYGGERKLTKPSELVEKGYIDQITYEEFYRSVGLDIFAKDAAKIHGEQNLVYRVTKEGNEKVALKRVFRLRNRGGGGGRKSPMREKGLVPARF